MQKRGPARKTPNGRNCLWCGKPLMRFMHYKRSSNFCNAYCNITHLEFLSNPPRLRLLICHYCGKEERLVVGFGCAQRDAVRDYCSKRCRTLNTEPSLRPQTRIVICPCGVVERAAREPVPRRPRQWCRKCYTARCNAFAHASRRLGGKIRTLRAPAHRRVRAYVDLLTASIRMRT